jgi:hypothetical protein
LPLVCSSWIMAGCLYLCKAGFIRLCMHGHVFACMDGDCLFMDDNTLIVPGFPPWRFYSALRLTCFWLQLVGFWLQLLLLRVFLATSSLSASARFALC